MIYLDEIIIYFYFKSEYDNKMKDKYGLIRNGKIRIISGKWKGRRILVASQFNLRPTTSRIRETLFNWLDPVISGSVCLDCFAGSGALGLESLSRGAREVTFIDKNDICISVLNRTIQILKEYNSKIIHSDCCYWLERSSNTYDIVFIDPPFQEKIVFIETIFLLEKYNHFKKEAWIYLETAKNVNFLRNYTIPNNWFLYRKMITKTILCCLYFRKS